MQGVDVSLKAAINLTKIQIHYNIYKSWQNECLLTEVSANP